MSARRADYFRLALVGEDGQALSEVYRSLRFATHCELTVVSDRPRDESAPWVRWTDIADGHAARDAELNADLVLRVTRGECMVGSTPFGLSFTDRSLAARERADPAIKRGSAELDEAARSACQLTGVAEAPRFIRLEFFGTCRGETQFVGMSCSPDRKVWVPISNEVAPEVVGELRAALTEECFAGSVSCELRRDAGNAYAIAGFDRSCRHWNAYRALGVNIPLLHVQDFLQRRFDIVHFVDIEHLSVAAEPALRYCFELEHVYVDLDETLVIDNTRVDYVTAFLRRCVETGSRISLVSRHVHDITETLSNAGIDSKLFEKIHTIAKHEQKSDWVATAKGAVFIDNEFAERLDVRQRRRIPVLDINQLDFLDLATFPAKLRS